MEASYGSFEEEVADLPSRTYTEGGRHFVVIFADGPAPEFPGEGLTREEASEVAVLRRREWWNAYLAAIPKHLEENHRRVAEEVVIIALQARTRI